MGEFVIFKSFFDLQMAEEIACLLKENKIDAVIEDRNISGKPDIAGNAPIDNSILLKIKPADFVSAREVLVAYYKEAVKSVHQDYYLFQFTNQELIEILYKPDEWGEFDYILAQQILSDRGEKVTPELLHTLTKEHINHASKKERIDNRILFVGFFIALLGGLGAIFFGLIVMHSKKTLINGEQVYTYAEEERNYGAKIILAGVVATIIWALAYIYLMYLRDKTHSYF